MDQFKFPEGMALTGITKLPRHDPDKVWWQVSLSMTKFFEPLSLIEHSAAALKALGMPLVGSGAELAASGTIDGSRWFFNATVAVPVKGKDLF